MGAIPAVAASKVAGVMPWARAVLRASARKASNLALPEPGGAGGGAMRNCEQRVGPAGVGLGAVAAQATATSAPHRAARR